MASYYFRTSHATDPSMRAVRDFREFKRVVEIRPVEKALRFGVVLSVPDTFLKLWELTASSRTRTVEIATPFIS